ncbi:MAG: quinohemoprotein ethanol dehydrogenase [Solirubrobacterales bacterium]|nr:quinohemoprotein ethanol dehydrogenase [Solirubrobacterales bacterium]
MSALAALILVASLSGCGSSSSGKELTFDGSGYPGVDAANSREARGSIDSSNVSELKEVWSLPLTAQSAYGAHSSSPVIVNGVIYSQDLESNVQAIDLESGEVQWTKKYEEADEGPNGVVVGNGMVFGATAKAAFALDQKTGREIWSVPLTTNSGEAIDMAPGQHDGLVYVSTVPTTVNSAYPGGGVGTLWALDDRTGKRKWHFDTVPKDLWGDPEVNSGGGVWQPPSFDDKGFIYFGTGNPAPYPGTPQKSWGSSRPGANLYTNSMVKLDAATGRKQWHYQLTPHDIYDWDFQDPPLLINASGKDLAVGAGKSGIVVALNAETGKPVWRRPVGTHNGHDNDNLYAMRGEYSKIKPGEVFPGILGGVIAPMATDGKTIFVPIVNHSASITANGELGEGSEMTGELVAIDAASGKVKWNQEFSSALFGAPTVVNDVVFATAFEGDVYAFDTASGNELWVETLPASINTSVSISGDTMIAPAGLAGAEGQTPEIVAYRLGG